MCNIVPTASVRPPAPALTGSTGCEAIAKALRSNIAVKELDISHTSIDDKAAAALSTMLSTNKRLERLVMTHTNVTDAGAQLLCNALQGNATLQVSGCFVG